MSQLPSVMLAGKWGGCPVCPLVPLLLCTSLDPSRNVFCLYFVLLKFCLFQHSFTSQWYCPSGFWAKDKLCACGKYLCGCSRLCISNSRTHVTTGWTCWTLSGLKRRWSECLGVLAWVSWDLEQGGRHWWGKKNRWMNVDWKRGWGKMLWWGSTAAGYQHSTCLVGPQCMSVVLLLRGVAI